MASLPKITIGIDAATRAKLKNNLVAQLSFFSITQTDDPIPRTNFTFSVYYVLGALAALLYALLDPSCKELTAYRRDAPIDECTEMLATFTCRTADYDRATGAGFARTFDAFTCLAGKNYTEEVFGAHSPSKCSEFKDASFKSRTADYDANTGTGLERAFSPAACPSRDNAANIPVYSDENPPATCTAIQETTFKCRTADHDATTTPVTGWEQEFTVATCPTDGFGSGNVFAWYDVSDCGNLDETTLTCRRTSKCGSNVQGSAVDDGGDLDFSYGGSMSSTYPHATCLDCISNNLETGGFMAPANCRKDHGQCCGSEPVWYEDVKQQNFNWMSGSMLMGDYTDETIAGRTNCPAGSMDLMGFHCVATGETACECPESVQTGVSVAKTSCADPVALDDYAACGTACGKTYDSSSRSWDASGDSFFHITGAVVATGKSSTGVSHYQYEECQGTKSFTPVTFAGCSGTRDVSVTFASCEGTADTPVAYSVCDGFVTICPETPMSVRLSQAMAYAATWMSALAFLYNYLGQRELTRQLARRVDRVVAKNDLVDGDDDEDDEDDAKPGDAAKKGDDVDAAGKKASNAV